MKIFLEGDSVRFQLMDTLQNIMLFDFKIDKMLYNELKRHMIENLNNFTV